MDTITLEIRDIKNISSARFEIPMEKGVYAFVGNNGCGKSTLLLSLAQIISRHYLGTLKKEDYSEQSYVSFQHNNITDVWTCRNDFWVADTHPGTLRFNGMYEGSLFYGTRFNDSRIVDKLVEENSFEVHEIVNADTYIKDRLSYILHGDYSHYRNIKKVRNKYISQKFNLKNTPYFDSVRGRLISQYRMSSGECLLISLLHFVYNSLVRKSLPKGQTILMLIDEIELALHPIAVDRLLDLLSSLVDNSERLVIILTTHAPEVIKKISPKNIFKIENNNGVVLAVNPCYPSYAIRDVYTHDGFDYLLLVEDQLAKIIVNKVLLKLQLSQSRLINITPAGGWENVLNLQHELLANNVLGVGKEIISILDGDVEGEATKQFQFQKKLFLPIKSVEKLLYDVLINRPNPAFKKVLNDKYFTLTSIDTLLSSYAQRYPRVPEHPDKKLYFLLQKDLESRGIGEKEFITNLADDIIKLVDFSTFEKSLSKLIS